TVFLAMGAPKVVIDESLASYFHDTDPVKQAHDRFRGIFGGDEDVYIVYQARDGDIFSQASMEGLQRIHRAIEHGDFGHIREVKSLINAQYLEGQAGSLTARNFVGDDLPTTAHRREMLRNQALDHPDYPLYYLSGDSQFGGILIRTDFNAEAQELPRGNESAFDTQDAAPSAWDNQIVPAGTALPEQGEHHAHTGELPFQISDVKDYPIFMAGLGKLLEAEAQRGALTFHPVGQPVLMDFFARAVIQDMGRLMAIVLVLMSAILWILFRSFAAVVWPLTIVILTVIWTLGLIGHLGVPMSAMVQIIIFLALAVGIADSVHILSGFLFFRNQGLDHGPALAAVFKKSGPACFLTSITTAVGLGSLTLVPLKPIATFGAFAALAVILAFAFTMILIPLMLGLWAPVSKNRTAPGRLHPIQAMIRRIEGVGTGHPKAVLTLFAVLVLALAAGATKLEIDSNFVEIIKEGRPLRTGYTLVDDHMGGTGALEIMLDFKRPDALKDPGVMAAMDRVQTFMDQTPETQVVHSLSMVNAVKESFKALNGGDPDFYRVPEKPALLDQVVFLFDTASPIDRQRLASDDYSAGRVGVRTLNMGSSQAVEVMETIQTAIDQNFTDLGSKYPDMAVTLTGSMAMLSKMLDYVAWAQLKSFTLALGVISLIMLAVLGSWKAGLTAMVPNLFPILTLFGLMGALGIPLDADTLLIAPVIMGLAVDDTIHFMTHFRMEMARPGATVTSAATMALREAGQAVTFTSLILGLGFLVFILSFHQGISNFGIFSALAIFAALLADLFFLPALCRALNLTFNREVTHG
ncbi:MAG: MMPL family transporter, partial [Desulfobacterales bacterium]|nr:MMPL family transporter [Desulfobacterales bacterium]